MKVSSMSVIEAAEVLQRIQKFVEKENYIQVIKLLEIEEDMGDLGFIDYTIEDMGIQAQEKIKLLMDRAGLRYEE